MKNNKLKIEETKDGNYVIVAEKEDTIVAEVMEAHPDIPETLSRVNKMIELYNDWVDKS